MKVVYVTGCLGFIGYYVAEACLKEGWYVIGVDKITYAANPDLLPKLQAYGDKFKFIRSDINDLDRLYDCDYVINTAAETHVDNSIVANKVFLESNINGVHHLLELIKTKNRYKMPTLLHFSTDEVYGDIVEGFHVETDLLKPSNPYSASKAAADMLILAWARTYNVNYVIARPTNNYGIGQYVEKLVPKSCKRLTLGQPIDLHMNGTPKRTWLHASDTANAVITIVKSGKKNEIYNINGNYECTNRSVIEKIVKLQLDKDSIESYITDDYNRPGQDLRYALNDDKLKSLGWNAVADFDFELSKIVQYHMNNFVW
jgi:dTDP-glucose 4,6-dehydratase